MTNEEDVEKKKGSMIFSLVPYVSINCIRFTGMISAQSTPTNNGVQSIYFAVRGQGIYQEHINDSLLKTQRIWENKKKVKVCMAGVLGFEPRDAEIKTRCLTAWRYPNNYVDINEINGAGRGT